MPLTQRVRINLYGDQGTSCMYCAHGLTLPILVTSEPVAANMVPHKHVPLGPLGVKLGVGRA